MEMKIKRCRTNQYISKLGYDEDIPDFTLFCKNRIFIWKYHEECYKFQYNLYSMDKNVTHCLYLRRVNNIYKQYIKLHRKHVLFITDIEMKTDVWIGINGIELLKIVDGIKLEHLSNECINKMLSHYDKNIQRLYGDVLLPRPRPRPLIYNMLLNYNQNIPYPYEYIGDPLDPPIPHPRQIKPSKQPPQPPHPRYPRHIKFYLTNILTCLYDMFVCLC